ncbi:helix-turn-helix domain-containing protein [Carbonactinospora thermoautotrophica]|uniref:helix-turn-helix domain-containing protein n=1 Tax=Carbonactinospora thermoautotrophica TaxID=1469144 RepID=UPI0038B335A1
MSREWLTTQEAAALLGVSERRMRQLAARLGARKQPDGLLLFPRSAVEQERERRASGRPVAEPERPRRPVADVLEDLLQ